MPSLTSPQGSRLSGIPLPRRIRGLDLLAHTTTSGFAWIVATEVAIFAWAVLGAVSAGWPDSLSMRLFALLTAFAILHMEATRPAEERRRAAHLSGEHIDHTGVWTCAGALVLPIPLVVALVLVIRVRRYFIARKPPGRYVFTTFAITSSALAAQALATATPLHNWVRGARVEPNEVLAATAAVAAAFGVYYLSQTVVIGIARGLRGDWSWVSILGNRKENADLAITLCLGLIAAWGAGVAYGLLLAALSVVVVGYTRHTQRIEQLELERDRLEVDALHDPLTGLANQRGFNPAAALALVADQARRRPTAVMMFDLDRFKQVNSRLGHLGANEVLKALAGVLRTSVRRDDLVCRWGGEEFSVLLPSTSRADAWAIAERIRSAVESMTVELTKAAGGRTEQVGEFTISGGIALSPEHGTDLATLQEFADQALAEAKDGGRNQIRLTPAVPLPGPRSNRERTLDPS
ncbi:diguanylate cyclase (GGDEF) domain-containing protein [Actinokineospora globicatena]|uniref:GGDEF domain-containing protein n=1 Tax=Actinokineospora globicatena TaxID=103729 RepID=A0A9W6VBP0_9PSEU|nr:diguanylate cyclase (GGDEF) domain-containing protein [Actinokineospora globicatena]GLW77398.1 GGDEF domain-containing protein [Actinokineospora globicatena]GLW84232.1 GGDEF domain-containing protein [Actinokineospora globicatena]GLW95507.1 GGDEF domain-containing protein [Actinokineospora globicatena]